MADRTYDIPTDCRFARSDEWVRVDGLTARIGVTDYAQSELSDVVFVEMPEPSAQIETDQPFGVIESVKAVSDLTAPISGEVVAINEDLEERPEWVNEDPYGRGWIIEVAPEDLDAIDQLMSPDEYRAYVEERSGS